MRIEGLRIRKKVRPTIGPSHLGTTSDLSLLVLTKSLAGKGKHQTNPVRAVSGFFCPDSFLFCSPFSDSPRTRNVDKDLYSMPINFRHRPPGPGEINVNSWRARGCAPPQVGPKNG
jgi:hypothetical protein